MSSRATSSRTSRSALSENFREFDSRRGKRGNDVTDILCPKNVNYEYRRLFNAVVNHGRNSGEDSAALKIQCTWRMHVARQFYKRILRGVRAARRARQRPYFVAMMLNARICGEKRNVIFETQVRPSLFLSTFSRGYYRASFRSYAVTEQMLLPMYIGDDRLARFVKTCWRSKLSSILLEWRLLAKTMKRDRAAFVPFKKDAASAVAFGPQWKLFHVWARFVKERRHKEVAEKSNVPLWTIHKRIVEQRRRWAEQADRARVRSLQISGVRALLQSMRARKRNRAAREFADEYRKRMAMKYALSAWAHYVVNECSEVNTKRAVIRRWFGGIQRNLHLGRLLKMFEQRHEIYQKRGVMQVLAKNRQISRVVTSYSYAKIQEKHCLALWLVAELQNDNDQAPFYYAMNAWVQYYRRRKMWSKFIFANINTTYYEPAKKKALAGLRKSTKRPLEMKVSMASKEFAQNTMNMYQTVMTTNPKDQRVFLLLTGTEGRDVKTQVENASTEYQQREVFFTAWKATPKESSLMMRLAIINAAKRRAINRRKAMSLAEKTAYGFQRAVKFWQMYNIGSQPKLNAVLQTITTNNKRALQNRMMCLARDRMLVNAHTSHSKAVDVHDDNPIFTVNDVVRLYARIAHENEELSEKYIPLINVTTVGSVLEQPDDHTFGQVLGLKTKVPRRAWRLGQVREGFRDLMAKSVLTEANHIQFERLLSGVQVAAGLQGTVRTFLNSIPYRVARVKPGPVKPATGFNDGLLYLFPLKWGRPAAFGKKVRRPTLSAFQDEVEEEDEETPLFLQSVSRESMSSVLSYNSTKPISLLVGSFASFMSGSNQALLSSENESTSNLIPEPQEAQTQAGGTTSRTADGWDNMSPSGSSYFGEAYDRNTMQSLGRAGPVQDPEVMSKYEIFLEILFGKYSRDVNTVAMNNLRERLAAEFRSHAVAAPTTGMNLQEEPINIGNLLDMYHQERKAGEPRELKSEDNDRASSNISRRSQRVDPITNVTYQCRRYKPLSGSVKRKRKGESSPSRGGTANSANKGSGDENDSYENEYYSDGDGDGPRTRRSKRKVDDYYSSDEDENSRRKQSGSRHGEGGRGHSSGERHSRGDGEKSRHSHRDSGHRHGHSSHGKGEEHVSRGGTGDGDRMGEDGYNDYEYYSDDEDVGGTADGSGAEEGGDNAVEGTSGGSASKKQGPGKSSRKGQGTRGDDALGKGTGRRRRRVTNEIGNDNRSGKSGTEEGRRRRRPSNITEGDADRNKRKSGTSDTQGQSRRRRRGGAQGGTTGSQSGGDAGGRRSNARGDRNGTTPGDYDDEYEYGENGETGTASRGKRSKHSQPGADGNDFNSYSYSYSSDAEDLDGTGKGQGGASGTGESGTEQTGSGGSPGKHHHHKHHHRVRLGEDGNDENEGGRELDPNNPSVSSSGANSPTSQRRNLYSPFVNANDSSGSNPMKDLDKVVFSYLKKENKQEGDFGEELVDIGEEEEAWERISSRKSGRQKLWTAPKQFPLYKPKTFERREWKKPEKTGPLVMTNKRVMTKALRDAINEESKLKKTMLSDSLSFTDSLETGRTTESQRSISSLASYSTYRSSVSGSSKLPTMRGDDRVVNFRGGQRGIMERPANFASLRIKQARTNLNHGSRVKPLGALEPLEDEKKGKKLVSHELADYSNLKSIVGQLIAMMIGSNDPEEFERFRRRARMLRKRPTFVGLYKTEKPDKRRLGEDLASIIARYSREKNINDAAEQILSLMGQSNDYASLIMDTIDQAVEEKSDYLPAIQAKKNQGQGEGDPTMAVHNLDIGWMDEVPEPYTAVAVQYLEGHDKPTNLDAKVARTDEDETPRVSAPTTGTRGPLVIPHTMTWDEWIRDIPLLDMMEATPYVISEELIDEVIHDAKRQLGTKRQIVAKLAT